MAILKPEREDRLLGAWNLDPATATDAQSRVAAQTLAKEALTANVIAEMPEESFKTEEERYGAAAKMVELMTGQKDLDGRLWNGGKGFKTGAEYLRSVKETLMRGMGAAADPELRDWLNMSDAEKDALVESKRGILSHVGEAAGDVASAAGELVRGVPRLSADEYESAPEDVREASDAMGSLMWGDIPEKDRRAYEEKVSEWRGGEWQRLKRCGEYEAKLRRKNALMYLPDMIKSLKSDEAKALAGELAQNPSEMPREWTTRLERLPTRDIETLAQIRGMTREHVEGGFLNWIGDMAIGLYGAGRNLLTSTGEQVAKPIALMTGFDSHTINETIRRRSALRSAYAGWSVAPISDQHGALANFTIGLASAVPFIASMHLKGLGYLACASEMMSEADAQAAAAGIDTTDPGYMARTAFMGGLYAYMLKAVSPKFLGASATGEAEDIALRTAFLKGAMSGLAKLDTMKILSQRTASGALMMAMQQGIAAVNEDLNLGGDAWRDAAERFTETFVSSIPDMLAFSSYGALKSHAQASGGLRKMFTAEGQANRSQSLREAVENAFAVKTAVGGDKRIAELRTNRTFAQIDVMRRAWAEGGEKGLGRLGLKPEEIAEAKEYFEAERKEYGAAERLRELDRETDAESLEEIDEDAPLAERNAAARRHDELSEDSARKLLRLYETTRSRMRDVPAAIRDLEAVRNVWAQGHAVGAGATDGTDAGVAALVRAGFSPKDAKALSEAFGAERRGMYSPAATEALRALYTRSTRGRVEATAAIVAAFGGKVRTVGGRTYIDFPMPDGGTGTLAVEPADMSQVFYGKAGSSPNMARQVEEKTKGKENEVKAEDWIKMSNADRRKIVECRSNPLAIEGDFVLTDPADPSLHVSAGEAETMIGTIRIDPRADPGAAFHEAGHSFLRFCQETGFFDEADLKWLRERYGAGGAENDVRVKGEDGRTHLETRTEQLDEEAAVEGFRQYLAKRMAGAITDEPGPFRKMFGLIGRLRHLRESRAATERLAANAEEALYDAFLAGRYQHIRDLKFAEPGAPAAEAARSDTGAPQTGAKPSAEEKADEELVHERSGVFNAALGTLKSLAETAGKIKSNFYKAVNEHFGADHSFDFGKPSGMLRGHLPDNPIQLKLQTLLRKRSEGYKNDHPFDFDEIADIVEQIHRPALLLKNEGDLPGVRAFFQVTSGRVFVVAIKPDGEINDISTLFPKDLGRLVKTIQMLKGRTGDVLGIDVEKAVRMLESRSNTASAQDPNDLSDAISVLKNLSPVKAMAKAGSILAPKDSTSQAENPALPSTERIVSNPGGGSKGEASPGVVRWEAQTPRGNKYVGGYYKVFRLSDLVHSNDPRYKAHAALQGRNRVDNKLEESDRDRIKAEFNGRRYLDNEVTSDGAPIVVMLPDAEGVTRPFVLSGNGRVLVLNDLAESHLYDRYRNPLKEWAAKNGVEMDVADGDNPVLVRVLDDLKGSNLLEVSRLSNVRTSTPPTETELARTDAEYLRSLDLARLYHANADGSPDMTPGVNDEFFRKFSQGPDAETTFDEKNNVGESAQRRIMRAFLHLAVGDSPRGLAAAEKLITMSGTYGIDRQKGALQMMAPGVARTEGNPDYAIGPDVARAIADFMDFTEMRRAGKVGKLDDYIAQGDMFDQPSEIAADILRTLAEGRGTARDMAERVNAYAEIAAHSDADGALGGAANARSRADVWREAKGLAEQRIAERTPKTRFSIRSEADGKKDEEKKSVVARVQPSEQGQNRPAHLRNDTTQRTLTPESAAPVREFGESISQSGVKSPADFLTGLVHALGSEETNPDKTQYFDITHEDGKNLSLRVANHRATARFYRERGNAADVKTSVVVKMSDKPFYGDNGVELTEHVYFSDRLTAEREAGIARAVAEWIGTGKWNGPAADQVNMSPRKRKSGSSAQGGRSFNGVTPEQDAAYAEAVKRGDLETARRMEREVYERMGYSDDSSYQGTSAFNGAAPSRNAYFETKAERIEATKNGEMEDTTTLGDYRDGIDVNNLQFIVFDPRSERNADPMRQEAIRNIRGVLDGGKDTITMYRSVPADVKETQFRNGDWITPSRAYAEENAQIHGWGDKFRVIEQEVSVEDVWWDGNDIAEWGFDDGKGSVYKNTAANRKLTGPTYDDAGNLIPLSKRFNDWKNDARYSIAGGVGAANMGLKGAAEAEAMEKAGADREEVWRTTGWWRGNDGKWRVELPPLKMKGAKDIETALREGGNETTLGTIVDAPELFKAYPDMKNVKVRFDPKDSSYVDAQYNRRLDSITIFNAGLESIADLPPVMVDRYNHYYKMANSDEYLRDRITQMDGFKIEHGTLEEEREKAKQRVAKYEEELAKRNALMLESLASRDDAFSVFSSLNHEIQHAIQEREMFARGASPRIDIYDPSNTISKEAIDEYRRAAGEVEARNVQKRLAMSPEERAATPPWETEDVPGDRQIVRYSIVSLAGRDVAVATDLEAMENINAKDPESVKSYILDHLEDGIRMLAGGTADINEKSAHHFAWSRQRGLGGRQMRQARAKAATVIRDLIGMFTADDSTYENDPKKDGVAWRCRLPFGVPRLDQQRKVIGAVVYDGDVIIKDDGHGKYFYDVSNLTKNETLTQLLDVQAKALIGAEDTALLADGAGSASGVSSARNIPNPSDGIKGDPEDFARRSVVARATDGEVDEKESALVAFVAERALRHGPKPNAVKTIGRLGLEMGLKAVDSKRIIAKGEALAERVRGTVIERALQGGDVATATALLAREADIDNLVAGAAGQGGQLVRRGEGKIKSILDREIEKTVRSFNAASLADVERDTGIDIAGEILANNPEKFDPKGAAKRPESEAPTDGAADAEGSASGGGVIGDGNLSDYEIARRQRIRKEAEERVAKMIATAKERSEAAKKEREEWEAKRDERKRRAEEAAASGEDGGGESGEGGGEGFAPGDRPKLSTFADFKTPEEFAAFFRVWAEDRYKKEHGASSLGKHEEKRLFPEFYRKAVVKELQDLADKLLPPKGARATVNRWLGELQPGVKPDTLERVSADVFAYINRNAIRESRTAQIQKFRNGLQEFVKGPQFDDLKLDADRRVTGWVEEAARYIRRVCNLSIQSINGEPSQLEKERAELQAILDRRERVYDDEGKNPADAPTFDMETRRALAKLQLLEKYGAMKRYMPGEIADLADEAMRWLRDEAVKLEAAWKDAREAEESIRGALAGGIVGPNGQKYKRAEGVRGWAERLFDSMNGMIRLRLQHLVRFADSAHQQKARDAINRVVVMLGDGETAFARHLQDDRAAFHNALSEIFTDRATGRFDRRACADWLNRMTEAIPADLSRRLSTQGYADSMTYGQMLQLLVSLEQKSYAEAIKANGREGQADLIRTFETVGPDGRRERVLTDKDILFIDWLRSFYEAKRGMLSEVTKRMTGLPIDSPDPLYCPVKMYMGDQARGMHVDSSAAWDPIGAVFSRRVETARDFDESASILGQFFDRSAASANLVAWGERGSIIRGVFTNAGVQQSIRLAFGGGELTKILKQLEETFNGGENIKKAPGEIAAADKAMNWMTYLSLGYNPLSAAKQTTSFTVWANALPGGFKDLWRYMTDVDMATIRHIKESEEFKVRYGNEVGSGHDVASKGLFENPSENPVAAFFRKTSMGLLRKGDFLPGGWIAQGVFRDLYNRHLKEGMDADAADRLAMTETFNMLEETQQSGRTYNTSELAREHGRLGRLLVQFATSPLQQLQYETQAAREVWDLRRYRPTTPDADFEKRHSEAKGRLIRAAVINHVLLPAALHAVTNLYRLAMGYDPEWENEGWHWTMLRDITLGQFSRVFFVGAISTVTADVLITGKPVRDVPALIPAEGVVKLFGNIAVTARDVAMLNYERVQKDLDRLLKSTSITRTPYDVMRLVTGRSYAEREERREKRRRKEARNK